MQRCQLDDTAGIAVLAFDALIIRELLEDALASTKLDGAASAKRSALAVSSDGFGFRSREALRGPASIGSLAKTVRRSLLRPTTRLARPASRYDRR